VDWTKAERENDNEAAAPKRSIIIYAVPFMLRAIFVAYFVFRPPSPGVFCARAAGCYDVDFGSGIGDGTIAYYLPDGERSRQFPLKRVSSGVYTVVFDGDEHVEVLVEDKDYLICNDETTYIRTSFDQVQRHMNKWRDALHKAHEEELARQRAEEEARAKLEREQEEAIRAALRKQLEEQRDWPRSCGGARSPQTPCDCAPGDPLCSCL
jgi:hypothetical protein